MPKFIKLHLWDDNHVAVVAIDAVAVVAPVRAHSVVYLRQGENVGQLEVRETVAEVLKLLCAEAH